MQYRKRRYGGVILLVLYSSILVILRIEISYFNPLVIVYELLAVFAILIIANKCSIFTFLESFGRKSYIIYFLHMQWGIAISSKQSI